LPSAVVAVISSGRVLDVFLYGAQLGGSDDGRFVPVRKARRQLDVQRDFAHHARRLINLHALNELEAVGGQTALPAKAQHINSGARAEGGQERGKGRRRGTCAAALRRLVGLDGESVKVRVHLRAAREGDFHFHCVSPQSS
jgi:hypothetical protein